MSIVGDICRTFLRRGPSVRQVRGTCSRAIKWNGRNLRPPHVLITGADALGECLAQEAEARGASVSIIAPLIKRHKHASFGGEIKVRNWLEYPLNEKDNLPVLDRFFKHIPAPDYIFHADEPIELDARRSFAKHPLTDDERIQCIAHNLSHLHIALGCISGPRRHVIFSRTSSQPNPDVALQMYLNSMDQINQMLNSRGNNITSTIVQVNNSTLNPRRLAQLLFNVGLNDQCPQRIYVDRFFASYKRTS